MSPIRQLEFGEEALATKTLPSPLERGFTALFYDSIYAHSNLGSSRIQDQELDLGSKTPERLKPE